MKDCPICAELRGEKVSGELCPDCLANWGLKAQYDWYGLVKKLKRDGVVFLVAYWLLIVTGAFFGRIGFLTVVFCSGLWVWNLWMYRRRAYGRRLDEEKGKLFLMKLRGKEAA